MSAMAHSGSGRGEVQVTPAAVREEILSRLDALESTVGSRVRSVDRPPRELLLASDTEGDRPARVADAAAVADTIARLRLLELSIRNRERDR